jgi:ubiquinone/menaquinone biosynthesis C-methylase UbiE
MSQIDDWSQYIVHDLEFAPGSASVVIDIGCGEGSQLARFAANGHRAFGVDLKVLISDPATKSRLVLARAEALPFPDAFAGAVLIKVVLPYTDDIKAMAEISRVLTDRGRCMLIGHGPGYSLRYALQLSDLRRTFYGCRTLLNSAIFFLTGQRLPGFLGDTITQTKRRLNWLYRRNGLSLISETPSPGFLGLPVFIYHEIQKITPVGHQRLR